MANTLPDLSPHEIAQLPADGGDQYNRLIFEPSPYLLQHATNPVDWWPWSDAAFEVARAQDKPVFLSIGYSTCHWCHVMKRESFENDAIARLMNEHFICIKLDREERPDVDNAYMQVTLALTGQGGWPMTVIMTPDRRPFFAGTYFPPSGRGGRPGMAELVPAIARAWREDRDKVLASADEIVAAVAGNLPSAGDRAPEPNILAWTERALRDEFDPVHGGFEGPRNKFPTPHRYMFLLRRWAHTGDGELLDIVTTSLKAMRRGGVYDQVGFGLHRYSTDQEWLLPHFEKMLYDQALYAMACVEAHQATGDGELAAIAREVFTYVLRDMTSPEGGFYSAEDAESEGEEGKFYVWTPAEVIEVLGEEDGALFNQVHHIIDGGNFHEEATGVKTGESIPHLRESLDAIAAGRGEDPAAFRARIDGMREKLFDHREARIHPHKDDKVLTDWNGLMIAAFARGGAALEDEALTGAARRAADFALETLRAEDGRLLKRYRNGEAGLPAVIDDYAFLAWGLVELYQATFDERYLVAAVELTDRLVEDFGDDSTGGFFISSNDSEELIFRGKELYDGATPSGVSVAAYNLVRLGRMLGRSDYEERAERLFRSYFESIAQHPTGHTFLLMAYDFQLGPTWEIVLAGDAAGVAPMASTVRTAFAPRAVLVHRPGGENPSIAALAGYVAAQLPLDGLPTAYICQDFTCRQPLTDLDAYLDAVAEAIGPR